MGSLKEANKKDLGLLCSFRLIYQTIVPTVHAEDLTQMYSYSVLVTKIYTAWFGLFYEE